MDLSNEDSPSLVDAESASAPPPRRPGVWAALGTVVLYFVLQLGLSILAGLAIGVVAAVRARIKAGVQHHTPDMHAIARTALANPDVRAILTVFTIAAATVVMIALVRQTWPAQWSRPDVPGFGFIHPPDRSAYVAAVVLGIAVLLLGGAMTHLLAHGQPVQQDVTMMAGKVSPGMRILLALLVVCVAPVVEELVFRGVLLSGLASRMRIGWAIVASAVIFGCVHLPDFKFAWYPVPALILLGLVLGWLRVRTHSLWPSIALHATNNCVAAIMWLLVSHH